MIHFSVAFGIKFKYFILAHRVLYCRGSACLFSIICLPHMYRPFSQLDPIQLPRWATVIHGFVFFRTVLPCEQLSTLLTQCWLRLEGPLCALVLSAFLLLGTLSPSHSLGMWCALFTSLDFTLTTPLPVEITSTLQILAGNTVVCSLSGHLEALYNSCTSSLLP